jgi:hypothetical protein
MMPNDVPLNDAQQERPTNKQSSDTSLLRTGRDVGRRRGDRDMVLPLRKGFFHFYDGSAQTRSIRRSVTRT